MWPYYFVLVLLLLIRILSESVDRKQQKQFLCVISFLVLFAFSALRSETVGGDLVRYLPEYDSVCASSFQTLFSGISSREPGYLLLEKMIGCVSPSHRWYMVVISFFTLVLFFNIITQSVDKCFIAILFFYLILYTNSFNILRASLATAICMNSYRFILERRFIPFCIVVSIAFLIQRTAISFLPIYCLYGRRLKPWVVIAIIMGIFVFALGLSGSAVMAFINTHFEMLSVDDGMNDYMNETPSLINPLFIFLFGMTCLGLYGQHIIKRKDRLLDFYVLVMAVATCIQAFSSVFTLMNRIALFYYCFIILYVPYLLKYVYQRKSNKRILFAVVGLLLFYMFASGLSDDPQAITPYTIL